MVDVLLNNLSVKRTSVGTMQLTHEGLWDEPKQLTREYLLDELELQHYVAPAPETLLLPPDLHDGESIILPEEVDPPEPILMEDSEPDVELPAPPLPPLRLQAP